MNAPGVNGEDTGNGGGKASKGEIPSPVLTLALSQRNSVLSSSSWLLRLKAGLPTSRALVCFSCRVNGVEVGSPGQTTLTAPEM